jgi:hypothetical protein
MASGDTLCIFTPLGNEAPSASYATLDLRNGHPCLDFDASVDENALWTSVLPRNYAGGGITITLIWAATSDTNTAHLCRWTTAIERCEDNGTDLDADSFATANTTGANPRGTSGALTYTTIAHTNGAQMDSVAVGEMFRLKVTRDGDGTSGTDDMTGDAELYAVEIKET